MTTNLQNNSNNKVVQPEVSTSNSKRSQYIVWLILFIILCLGIYLAVKPSKIKTAVTVKNKITAAEVIIDNNQFIPSTINVKIGQPVIWLNHDHVKHIIASDPYPSDNGLANFKEPNALTYNDRFNFTFVKAGKYKYHDDLNPFKLKGSVYVTN